jgi:hypothetical protein
VNPRRSGHVGDDAKTESFVKMRKVEAVYPMACKTFADVAENVPDCSTRSPTSVAYIPLRAI